MKTKSNKMMCSRRTFLLGTAAMAAKTALPMAGCVTKIATNSMQPKEHKQPFFPTIEVSGSNYDIGLAIGKRFATQIKTGLKRREAWFFGLRNFVEQDPSSRYQVFVDAAKKYRGYLTDVKNLLVAGQFTFPGGGMSAALMSGLAASMFVKYKIRKYRE